MIALGPHSHSPNPQRSRLRRYWVQRSRSQRLLAADRHWPSDFSVVDVARPLAVFRRLGGGPSPVFPSPVFPGLAFPGLPLTRLPVVALTVGLVLLMLWGSVRSAAAATDVRAHGAVGDGVADDTAAIQAAIDAAAGTVHFPPGVYRVTQPLLADLSQTDYLTLRGDSAARIEMHGAGPAIRLRGSHRGSAAPAQVAERVWQAERMPLIDGIAIEGKHESACGVEADGTMQLTITRSHFRGLLHAIHLIGNNRNLLISDCHLYHNRGVGIFLDKVNLHQINVTACHISYCEGGGIVSRQGNVRNLQITGCDIESNMAADQPPTANVLIDCRESRYGTGEVAITGCTIQHNRDGDQSANIAIYGGSQPSPLWGPTREGHITITGNVLSDVQTNIRLNQVRGVTITGNTIWQGYRHNLLLESCSHLIISGNNLDRNPRYRTGNLVPVNAVVLRDCVDCNLSGLHVSGVTATDAAVVLDDCRRINLSHLTILDCAPVGLLVNGGSHIHLTGSLIDSSVAAAESPQAAEEKPAAAPSARADEPSSDAPPALVAAVRVQQAQAVVVSSCFLGGPIEQQQGQVIERNNASVSLP